MSAAEDEAVARYYANRDRPAHRPVDLALPLGGSWDSFTGELLDLIQ